MPNPPEFVTESVMMSSISDSAMPDKEEDNPPQLAT